MADCHCGKPLHYSSPAIQAYVERTIALLGETIVVRVGAQAWHVPRHYLALHGLVARDLPTLGFKEVL